MPDLPLHHCSRVPTDIFVPAVMFVSAIPRPLLDDLPFHPLPPPPLPDRAVLAGMGFVVTYKQLPTTPSWVDTSCGGACPAGEPGSRGGREGGTSAVDGA